MRGAGLAFVLAICLSTSSLLAMGDLKPAIAGCPTEPGVPIWAVTVRVMTKHDVTAIENLQPANFAVTEDRVPLRICAFDQHRQPSSIKPQDEYFLALLIVSDGEDNASVYRSGELDRGMSDLAVPIFLVVPIRSVGLKEDRLQLSARDAQATEILRRIANRSGGYAISGLSKQEMVVAATQIASAIRSLHALFPAAGDEHHTTP